MAARRHLVIACIVVTSSCQGAAKNTSADNPQPSTTTSQGSVYLAYAEQGGGRPFLGFYGNGRLVAMSGWSQGSSDSFRRAVASILSAFPVGHEFLATSDSGKEVSVRIDSVNPEAEYYEEVLTVSYPGIKRPPGLSLFTTDSSVRIQPVPHRPASLTREQDSVLTARFRAIWDQALREREPEDTLALYNLATPQVHDIGSVLTVLYPVIITWPGRYRDDRGSAFFIYSKSEGKIVFDSFGHPEWAPVDSSVMLMVRPALYFRVGTDSTVYFFGDHQGGWESAGMAIHELKSGRVILHNY